MPSVKLNFINRSNDTNKPRFVIFQKNEATAFSEIAVAWKVIVDCDFGENHPFDFDHEIDAAASDSWGNYTPQLKANPGDSFELIRSDSGDTFEHSGNSNNVMEIEIKNNLPMGSINAWIYRNRHKLAAKTNLAPGQMAAFAFKPVIFVGVVSEIEEGEIMDSSVLSEINTELLLLGIESADIVATGGGAGPASKPISFHLENVVKL